MNGGPGCSSMDGLFYEQGQLLVGGPNGTLVRNPYAWTKLAHMMYLEAPVGVGYSYSDDPVDEIDDNFTASDNLAALKVFFSLFPEHKQRDFYVSGESYAGVYVPTLSLKIFEDPTVDWNMKGFIVGNGVFDWNLMQKSSIPFLYGHGAISTRMKNAIDEACSKEGNPDCASLQADAEQRAEGLNGYDFYRSCFGAGSEDLMKNAHLLTGRRIAQKPELLQLLAQAPRPAHPALGENVPCIDSVAGTKWLGSAAARAALHIKDSLPAWEICARINYKRNMNYSAPALYAQMMDKYRILVYNGDTDLACDYVADSWAMDMIKADVDPQADWVPWKVGPQVAGYITKYQTGPGMFFMTVKGAGHMVPQWKPVEALHMLQRFLRGDLEMRTDPASQLIV
mmetsp:Transcript_56537/g.100284  ORF Transcript_56537/g.100284 Transcript_56537/m.100284 type:complete len:396 (-) Transcript_56537:34-1221(-)